MQLAARALLRAVAVLALAAPSSAAAAGLLRQERRHAAADGARTSVTPVQKVIEMLDGMLVKAKEEKHQEEVQFASYSQFCSDTEAEKKRAVQVADEEIGMLKANIQLAKTDSESLAREVQEHDGQIATWQGDHKAATKVREIERADYIKAHQDYSETIEAITKATQVLKAQNYNRAQAPAAGEEQQQALAQLAAALGPALARGLGEGKGKGVAARGGAGEALAAFLAQARDPAEALLQSQRGPEAEAYAYESRSGGVVDMLSQLKDKFGEERSALEKEELNKRHAYELLAEDLKASVSNAEDSRSSKSQQRAKRLQSSAEMQSELTDTTATRADDSKYLQEMTATCKQKAADFEERQKLRADEIVAIGKAIEILSSASVKVNSQKYLAALQRARSGTGSAPARARALLQVGSSGRSPTQLRAAAYLEAQAHTCNSDTLALLALRTREDPFGKVKKMLRDLINRLQEAAGEEAEHESWCRAELSTNEQVRSDRTTTVERLMSEIDSKKSTIAKLTSEVSEISVQLSDTQKATAELTKMREAERTENVQTVKDAQDAQTAVGQAVTVLREFYAMAGDATAFVQGGAVRQQQKSDKQDKKQEPPAIFEDTYQGMGTENGGVIAMLEVIQSDFARLESTTSAAEATAEAEYNKQMSDSAVLKAQMQKDIQHKNLLKQQAEQAMVDMNNDLTSAQKELSAAQAYFEKLKPSCLESGMSFEERSQRRTEEIESLQEALRILNGEDVAVG